VSRMPLFQLCGDEAAEARSKYYLFPSPQAGILNFNFWAENPGHFAMEIVLWRSKNRYYGRLFKLYFCDEKPRDFAIKVVFEFCVIQI
jgi:hypothetical protein